MKSLKRNFDKIVAKNPSWSTCTCFASAVKDQKFGKKTLQRWFNKLVDKEDFLLGDKKDVLIFMYYLSDGTVTRMMGPQK